MTNAVIVRKRSSDRFQSGIDRELAKFPEKSAGNKFGIGEVWGDFIGCGGE